jgi:hypothetical protein
LNVVQAQLRARHVRLDAPFAMISGTFAGGAPVAGIEAVLFAVAAGAFGIGIGNGIGCS